MLMSVGFCPVFSSKNECPQQSRVLRPIHRQSAWVNITKTRRVMPPHQVGFKEEGSEGKSPTTKQKKKEILYQGHLYDVTSWIDLHPGGSIIKFYTQPGEDATIPFLQFHSRSLPRTLAILKSLPHRKMEEVEEEESLRGRRRHKALSQDFFSLEAELREEGFFQPSPTHTALRFLELVLLQGLGSWCFSLAPSSLIFRILGILLTAMFAGRCGWLMHEGGHHSITGRPALDKFLQSFLIGVAEGMSASWWSSQHNRHHAMPQRLHHDVDLDTLPLLAFNRRILLLKGQHKATPLSRFFLRHQAKLFVLVDTLLVTFVWKLYLHPRYAWRKGAWSDLIFMAIHYTISLQFGLLNYLAIIWLTSIYIFFNFALSHTHLPVTEGGLHWVEYSLLHTMDINPSPLVNWWMCYLNFQVEHHLFPTMPQFRHAQVRPRVEALARKHNLPFHSVDYWTAVKITIRNLDRVSQSLHENEQ